MVTATLAGVPTLPVSTTNGMAAHPWVSVRPAHVAAVDL